MINKEFTLDIIINNIQALSKNKSTLARSYKAIYQDYLYRSVCFNLTEKYSNILNNIEEKFKDEEQLLDRKLAVIDLNINNIQKEPQLSKEKYQKSFPGIVSLIDIKNENNLINQPLNISKIIDNIMYELEQSDLIASEKLNGIETALLLKTNNKSILSIINENNLLISKIAKLAYTRKMINILETEHKEELAKLLSYSNSDIEYQNLKENIFSINSIVNNQDVLNDLLSLLTKTILIKVKYSDLIENKKLIEQEKESIKHKRVNVVEYVAFLLSLNKLFPVSFAPISQGFYNDIEKTLNAKDGQELMLSRQFLCEPLDLDINEDFIVSCLNDEEIGYNLGR